MAVDHREIGYVKDSLIEFDEENEYTEYFDYVLAASGISLPSNWREAISTYEFLINIAENGHRQ